MKRWFASWAAPRPPRRTLLDLPPRRVQGFATRLKRTDLTRPQLDLEPIDHTSLANKRRHAGSRPANAVFAARSARDDFVFDHKRRRREALSLFGISSDRLPQLLAGLRIDRDHLNVVGRKE